MALRSPAVNHLLFADDSLFFSLANPKAGRKLKQILNLYEKVSGQAVNLNKSSITFGSKFSASVKTRMRTLLGILNEGGNGKYLGLPEQFNHKKGEMFQFIIDKVIEATQGWNRRFLSHGGKEILLKTVALAMLIYSMSIFRLPKTICEEINTLLANFWWGSGTNRGMHWYNWKRICVPKKEGGLGFRDLERFNQALLSNQVWRLLQQPGSLVARILKARYFAEESILTAQPKRKASYAWKSLLYGRDLLIQGLRFIIGNGTKVSMWSDPSLAEHPPRPPRSREKVSRVESVSSYIKRDGTGWDIEKLREVVIDEDIDKILSIRISSHVELDLLGWHYTEEGIYTVKSGYWLNTHLPQQEQATPTWGDPVLKKKIWKCNTPPKINHFLWKLLSKSLATGSNLKRRHVTQDDLCKRCCSAPETELHLFFECPYAQRIWRGSGISNTTLLDMQATLEDKIDVCLTCNISSRWPQIQDLPISILWRIWKSRNSLIFQHRNTQWWRVLEQAKTEAQEWSKARNTSTPQQNNHRSLTETSRTGSWHKPRQGWYKCNFDASFTSTVTQCKLGWVIRGDYGEYRGAGHAK